MSKLYLQESREKTELYGKRIAAIIESFVQFAVPDENFVFVVDPSSRQDLSPYFSEVETLKATIQAVHEAIDIAYAEYHKMREIGLVAGDEKDLEPVIKMQSVTDELNKQLDSAKSELRSLTALDNDMQPSIAPENEPRARELRVAIQKTLPRKIQTLEKSIEKCKKAFEIKLPAPGNKLPRRGSRGSVLSVKVSDK